MDETLRGYACASTPRYAGQAGVVFVLRVFDQRLTGIRLVEYAHGNERE
jgi:hypothetical protein